MAVQSWSPRTADVFNRKRGSSGSVAAHASNAKTYSLRQGDHCESEASQAQSELCERRQAVEEK